MAQQEVQQEAQQPLLLNALKEAQECIKVLIKKIESDHSFDHEFQYDESCIAELEKKLRTYQKKTSSSLDARKMYGDVAPGDTTHQNVILLYQNYFKNAFRSLPKELNTQAESKEEKYEIWKIISIIVQESFSQSREAIVTTVIGKLKKVLLTDMPITEPLDEATNDFFRAFNMYITSEIDGIKEIEKKLLSEVSEDDSCYLQQAVALTKESDPDCYYRFFQDEKGNGHHVPSIAADHGSQRDARGTSKDVKGNDNSVSTIIFSHIFGRSIKGTGLENETILNISEKLDRNIKEVKKRIKVVEKVKSLNREIEELQKEIEEMKKRATDDDALHKPSLHFEKKDLIKPWHEKYVSKLLEKLKNDLRHLLSCSSDVIIERSDARETYKIYGLLLSACKLRESKPPDAVEKVLGAIQNEDSRYSYDVSIIKGVLKGEAVKKYVQEAVDLTYKMLTLLPPLVVTVYPEEYKEELHDTNRLTWDESDESHKLIYYRPLLVYGNQLQVAARGLVGNK